MNTPLSTAEMQMVQQVTRVKSPMLQFFSLYGYMAGFGFVLIEIVNLIQGNSIRVLLAANVWIMLGQMCVFLGSFSAFVWWRLGRLFWYYLSGQPASEILTAADIKRFGDLVLYFPSRLFRAFMLLAVFLSLGYHLIEWWALRGTPFGYAWDWTSFFSYVSFEQGLSLLIALLLYSQSHRILRPVVRWLAEGAALGLGVRLSIRHRLYIVTLSLMTMGSAQDFNLAVNMRQHLLPLYLALTAVFLILTYWFVRSALEDTVRDIDLVRNRLAALTRLPSPQFDARLPVESGDELADLKLQFNALQRKTEQHYLEQEAGLALAGRVQMQLLPKGNSNEGRVSIRGNLLSKQQVGGDFYDVVRLSDEWVAVIIGDVSGKGMPAALVTATFLGMFRSEIHRGGGPASVLHRLHQSLSSVLMPSMYVTAGLLYVNGNSGLYRYASAGHLPPLQVTINGNVAEWDVGSLPLGFMEVPPSEITGSMADGDRLLLYTDGTIEDSCSDGLGFKRLASHFARLSGAHRNTKPLLDGLLEGILSDRNGRMAEDDQTLVVVAFGK